MMEAIKMLWQTIEFFWNLIYATLWSKTKQAIPSLDKRMEILACGVSDIASAIRKRKCKAKILLTLVKERAEMVNPVINAITHERFEQAMVEAKRIDETISNLSLDDLEGRVYKKKPLLGVPFTVQESLGVEDFFCTLGLTARSHLKAPKSATFVQRLCDAGAIPFAVTNIPETDIWSETRNNVYGQTNNPYHQNYSVGGSGGGEACLVATACSPFGIARDVAGSSLRAASYCGVFAHVTSAGLIECSGVGITKQTKLTPSLIVKTAEDLMPLLTVITGETNGCLGLEQDTDLESLNFLYIEDSNVVSNISSYNIPAYAKATLNRALNKLQLDLKCKIEPMNVDFNNLDELWQFHFNKENADIAELLANKKGKVNGLIELLIKLLGFSSHTLGAIIHVTHFQTVNMTSGGNKEILEEKLYTLKKDVLRALGSNGILILPSSGAAPKHYASFFRSQNACYWALPSMFGLPVTQVPMGLNEDGLPIGLQVISGPNNDRACIEVARYLEKTFGGYCPPFEV